MNFQPSVTKVCRSLLSLILLFPLIMISLISLESQAKPFSKSRTKVSRQKRVSQSSHKTRKSSRAYHKPCALFNRINVCDRSWRQIKRGN